MGVGDGLGCSGICAKYILFIINFAVFACGAVMLGLGLALFLTEDAWAWFDGITTDSDDPLIETALYIMIAVGGFLFLVGFFGCCGACKESKCMLTTYVGLVIIVLIMQIIGAALAIVFRNELDDTFSTAMYNAVYYNYGDPSQNTTTSAWDAMQQDLKCCGAFGPDDYENSAFNNRTGDPFPASCCVDENDYSTCTASAAVYSNETSTPEPLYYTSGCYDELKAWVEENTAIVIGVFIGLAVVQIIALCIGFCMRDQLN